MSEDKIDASSVKGHDTTAGQILDDLPTLRNLERDGRYELLADLHRDDAASDAGYFLLGDLIRESRMCEGEAKLDGYYIAGRIQLEALELNVRKFGVDARQFCVPRYISEVREALLGSVRFARSEADRDEILKIATDLNS